MKSFKEVLKDIVCNWMESFHIYHSLVDMVGNIDKVDASYDGESWNDCEITFNQISEALDQVNDLVEIKEKYAAVKLKYILLEAIKNKETGYEAYDYDDFLEKIDRVITELIMCFEEDLYVDTKDEQYDNFNKVIFPILDKYKA